MSYFPKATTQQIIDKYFIITKDYFEAIKSLSSMHNRDDISNIVFVGLNCIHRVFEYVLYKTKNIDTAVGMAQQTYFYYLEYIEQIHSTELLFRIKQSEAILFVYKKTVFELFEGNKKESKMNTLENIMTLDQEFIHFNNKEWAHFFPRIKKLYEILFYWNQSQWKIDERIFICLNYFHRYLHSLDKLEVCLMYLDYIQKHYELDFDRYTELLNVMIEKTEKIRRYRSNSITEEDKTDWFLIKIYKERDTFEDKLHTSMNDLVNWLLSEV
jgi:hypothetical protein